MKGKFIMYLKTDNRQCVILLNEIITLKGLIFRGLNFREFAIFEKFAKSIFANFEILKVSKAIFCDLLTLFANYAILLGNRQLN